MNNEELWQNLKRGIPQTIAAPELPNTEEILSLTKYFFERLIPNNLADINGTDMEESTFAPWGEDFLKITGYRIRAKKVNYDRLTFYADENDKTRFACREKLYLEPKSFQDTNFWESDPKLKQIKDLYEKTAALIAKVNQKVAPDFRRCNDQLMLVRYSVSSPDPKDKAMLAELGSKNFGVSHDDETLFSLHLAESYPELKCWDYTKHNWIPAQTQNNQCQLLLGDYSRLCGWIPSTHRLEPTEWSGEDMRYSVLFENTPEYNERIDMYPPKDQTSDKIGVVIRSEENTKDLFKKMAADGFEKVVVFEKGFKLKNPNLVARLLNNVENYPEKYSYKINHHHNVIAANLTGGRAAILDRCVDEHGWLGLKEEIPSNFDPTP